MYESIFLAYGWNCFEGKPNGNFIKLGYHGRKGNISIHVDVVLFHGFLSTFEAVVENDDNDETFEMREILSVNTMKSIKGFNDILHTESKKLFGKSMGIPEIHEIDGLHRKFLFLPWDSLVVVDGKSFVRCTLRLNEFNFEISKLKGCKWQVLGFYRGKVYSDRFDDLKSVLDYFEERGTFLAKIKQDDKSNRNWNELLHKHNINTDCR